MIHVASTLGDDMFGKLFFIKGLDHETGTSVRHHR